MEAVKKNKFKIIIAVTAVSLLILSVIVILCENYGLFPGNICNRIALSSYMSGAYENVSYSVDKTEFTAEKDALFGSSKKEKYYRFDCITSDGKPFSMKVYNFSVVYDGYFEAFMKNTELGENAERYVSDTIISGIEKLSGENKFSVDKVYCPFVFSKEQYEAQNEYSDSFVKKCAEDNISDSAVTLCVVGEKIKYDDYCVLAEKISKVITHEIKLKPALITILYYRNPAENEDVSKADVVKDGRIMQYESEIKQYQFEYAIASSSNTHYYVELSDSQKTKATIFEIIQSIYLVLIAVTVIALLILWTVRRIKKWRKEIRGAAQ